MRANKIQLNFRFVYIYVITYVIDEDEFYGISDSFLLAQF